MSVNPEWPDYPGSRRYRSQPLRPRLRPQLAVTLPGRQGEAAWEQLVALVPKMGFYPVLLGSSEAVSELECDQAPLSDINGVIVRAKRLDVPQLLNSWSLSEEDEAQSIPHCSWPPENIELHNRLEASCDSATGKYHSSVTIAFVQTQQAWQVPAFFAFRNGLHEVPEIDELLAIFKHWHDVVGLDLASITCDTIEWRMQRPPQTREAAMRLAMEHYLLCNDIINMGHGYIESLAASLMESQYSMLAWD